MKEKNYANNKSETIWWRVLINQIAFIGLHVLFFTLISIFCKIDSALIVPATFILWIAYTILYFALYRPLKPKLEFDRYKFWTKFYYVIIFVIIDSLLFFNIIFSGLSGILYDVTEWFHGFLEKTTGLTWTIEMYGIASSMIIMTDLAYFGVYNGIGRALKDWWDIVGMTGSGDHDYSGSSSSSSSSSRSDRTYFKGTDGRTYYSEVPPFDYRNEIFDEDGHSTGAFYRESTGEIYDNDNNVLGYFDSNDQFHENE